MTPDLLGRILADKRREIAAGRARCSRDYLESLAISRPPPPDFAAALRAAPMGLIAEVKHRSPSAGILRDPFVPAWIAEAYEEAGATAVSVLIDGKYFGGGLRHLVEVYGVVGRPLLYKEFVVDPWQVWQAAAHGAAAVLLIAAALSDQELESLLGVCAAARRQALVEVHDEEELRRAAGAGARCIGVNNRDLRTFQVSLDTSLRLAGTAPADGTLVSESGIRSPADVRRLRDAGFHAVLVGEQLLRQPDLRGAVRTLMAEVWPSS